MANTVNKSNSFILFITSGATNYPIAFQNNVKLDFSKDMIEITSKDSAGKKQYIVGDEGYTMSMDALQSFDSSGKSFTQVMNYYNAGTMICWKYAQTCGTGPNWQAISTNAMSGCAYINSISVDASKGGIVTYSASFQGTGAISS